MLVSQTLDVVTSAAILYVVAAGLLIIFGVMRIINFAHGAFLTLGGYSVLAVTNLGYSPLLAVPLSFIMGCLAGMVVERLVVCPLYGRPMDAILATWGLGIVIGQLITLAYDRGIHFVPNPLPGTATLFGEGYSEYRLAMVAIALSLGGILTAVLRGTRLGLVARAVIMNEDLARGLGIDSGLVRLTTFSLGSGLACLAGALITPQSSIYPSLGVSWLVNAFMLVLVSGTSLLTLGVAALVLGGAQVLVSSYVNPVMGSMAIAVLAAVLLRIRPKGFARD